MNHAKLGVALLFVTLSLLWWLGEQPPWPGLGNTRLLRALMLQYTGVLGIGVMSVAMVLAVRPTWLEPRLGGLDKMYRLHKWLGIAGLALSVAHWGISHTPRRGRGLPPLDLELAGPVAQFLDHQREAAAGVGDLAFKALVILVVLALIRRFPYWYFHKTHLLLAPTYLALVWHAVVLTRFEYWYAPLGPLMVALMAAGSVAALMVLTRRVGVGRQAMGEVVGIDRHDPLGVVALEVRLRGGWAGHEAGQFAFLTLDEREGAHPFTITSAWTGDGKMQFLIKALGDYTRTLPERVRVGDPVKVEGPYGCFDFHGETPRQIWVGAGIGIAPFVARLKALAQAPDGKAIDLIHPTAVYEAEAIGLLERDAEAAQVSLHVLWDERDGLLDAQRLTQLVPAWREADVWFCGPAAFGHALKRDLKAMGFPEERFHQELFELR